MEAYATWLPVIAALFAAGAVGGLIAGLLGVGGGIVLVPALDLALGAAGVDPAVSLHVAVATSMATIVPTAISSSRAHASRNAVDFAVVKRWAIPIVVGATAGSLAAAHVHGNVLAAVFGSVALLSALKMLLPLDRVVLREHRHHLHLRAELGFFHRGAAPGRVVQRHHEPAVADQQRHQAQPLRHGERDASQRVGLDREGVQVDQRVAHLA